MVQSFDILYFVNMCDLLFSLLDTKREMFEIRVLPHVMFYNKDPIERLGWFDVNSLLSRVVCRACNKPFHSWSKHVCPSMTLASENKGQWLNHWMFKTSIMNNG